MPIELYCLTSTINVLRGRALPSLGRVIKCLVLLGYCFLRMREFAWMRSVFICLFIRLHWQQARSTGAIQEKQPGPNQRSSESSP